jgi:hypothetical protein
MRVCMIGGDIAPASHLPYVDSAQDRPEAYHG